MKTIPLFTILILIFSGCQQKKSVPEKSTLQNIKTIIQRDPDYDSLADVISNYQDRIISDPENKILMGRLLSAALDSTSGCFLVAGKGVYNRNLPLSAQNESRKTAAIRSAQRWALYLKVWQQGDLVPLSTPVSGSIAYSKTLIEKEVNDTLFLLLGIPPGSISRD